MAFSKNPAKKHRTNIVLEHDQYVFLKELARRSKRSMSSVVRELIEEKIKHLYRRKETDSIFSIIGMASGDGSPVAREDDKYLYQE